MFHAKLFTIVSNKASEVGVGNVRKFTNFDKTMSCEELCLWLESQQITEEDIAIFRGNNML